MKRIQRVLVAATALGMVLGGLSTLVFAETPEPRTLPRKAPPPEQSPAEVGKPAPEFSLVSTTGKKVSLSQFKGKLIVLEWLNHGCPFVKKHYRSMNMQTLQKKYTAKGVVWLSIVSSAPGRQGFYEDGKANELTKSMKAAPTAVLKDPSGNIGKLYKAMTTPHMYVIDKKGLLRYAGAIDSIRSANPEDVKKAVNYVSKALGELMVGKEVSIPKTRPYGCSVKYAS